MGAYQLILLAFLALPSTGTAAARPPCDLLGDLVVPGKNGRPVLRSAKEYFLHSFLDFDHASMVRFVSELYPELRWLTKKVTISPKDATSKPHAQSPSMLLFGEFHPEVDRTITSIYVLQQILANDYAGFTAPQAPPVKLPEAQFAELRNLFLKVLSKKGEPLPEGADPATLMKKIDLKKLDALISYMGVHDTGKSKRFVDLAEKVVVEVDADHDRILLKSLELEPMMVITFDKVDPEFRHLMFETMKADFNMGQFAQGENIPGSLGGVKHLTPEGLEFYYAHLLLDVAGAHGVDNPTGGKLMMAPVYKGFNTGFQALKELAAGKSEVEVYDGYLQKMATHLSLPMTTKQERGLVRLALQANAKDATAAQEVVKAFESLPPNAREILNKELNVNGTDDGFGTLVYYAPQLIANSKLALTKAMDARASISKLEHELKALELKAEHMPEVETDRQKLAKQVADTKKLIADTAHFPQLSPEQIRHDGTRMALFNLARVYEQIRREHLKGKEGNGVFTATVTDLATIAQKDPYAMEKKAFRFEAKADGGDIRLEDHKPIDLSQIDTLPSLSALPGKSVIVVGYGGGTDGVQAAMVAKLMKANGKDVAGVISVRRDKPASLTSTGRSDQKRTLSGRTGGEVAPGVTRILPQTRGTGRFVENLPAQLFPTTLVVYDPSKPNAPTQLEKAIRDLVGNRTDVTVIAVDTGGDSLYPKKAATEIGGHGRATPDQDAEMLTALASATKAARTKNFISAVVAPGIDSPANATEALKDLGAQFYRPGAAESKLVLDAYAAWGLDGRPKPGQTAWGKTPLAFQAGLRNETGVVVLPIPAAVVTDPKSPWSPFMPVEPAMGGIMFMDGANHLRMINGEPYSATPVTPARR